MNVDDAYPLAPDRHFAPRGGRLKRRDVPDATAHYIRSGCCARESPDEIPATWHHVLPSFLATLATESSTGGRATLAGVQKGINGLLRYLNGRPPDIELRKLLFRFGQMKGRAGIRSDLMFPAREGELERARGLHMLAR